MAEREGNFRLVTFIGERPERPGRWVASALIHANEERRALETMHLEGDFQCRESARTAALDAAREIARRLDPDDSLAKRALPNKN